MTDQFDEKKRKIASYRKLREKKTRLHPAGDFIKLVADKGSFVEILPEMVSEDPIGFPDYREKLEKEGIKASASDAFICGRAKIFGVKAAVGELSKFFLMGSMGTVVGEKIVKLCEIAEKEGLPLVIFSASGGARMQEGMHSLMQMARTSTAVTHFKEKGGLFISILTDPVTGGVSASFASLGDITLAIPNALIGFAGPRVIEQTIGEKLPEGFQRAEFQKEHGFVDRIVEMDSMKEEIAKLLKFHGYGEKSLKVVNIFEPAGDFNEKSTKEREELTPYERVAIARDPERPKVMDFINALFTDFTELAGDGVGEEDKAMVGGLAYFNGEAVTVIGHRKGHDLNENLACNFGMPGPGGYRKAARLMKEAERFKRPVITFIDTPGAYPGKEAEERGISSAIAENLSLMSNLKVPVINVVTGEGNSGGALGIGCGDRMIMLENAVYSVLSPEGFSSILWKEKGRVKEACEVMKLTSYDIKEAGFADFIINEDKGGIKNDPYEIRRVLGSVLADTLAELDAIPADELCHRRFERYMAYGRKSACKAGEDDNYKESRMFV